MKKLLFVFVLGAFAACGSGSTEATATDSTKVDTTAVAIDSTKVDTAAAAMDTTKVDSTKK